MKPFSIQCDSCQAKLKVTKASAIGQILACPKCGSLVQVVAPEGLDEAQESATAPVAAADRGAPNTATAETAKATHQDRSREPAGAAPEGRDLLPSDNWTSAESRARRKLLGLFGLVGLAIVVAIVAIGYLATQFGRGGSRIARNDTEAAAENDSVTVPPATDGETDQQPTETDPVVEPPENGPGDDKGTPAESPEVDTTEEPTTPPDPQPDETPETPEPDEPPGFEAPSETGGESTSPFDVVLADLNALGSIMEESPFDKAQAIAERELRVAYRVRVAPAEVFAERPKPRDFKTEDQLAVMLPEVAIETSTLSRFLDLIRDLTGMPISIEPEALEAAGVTPSQSMSVSGSELTIADLLTANLQELGLGWYQTGDLIVISVANAQTLVTEEFPLDNITATFPSDDEVLSQLIMAMVDPPSWAAGNGTSIERQPDRLVIRQTPLNQYRIRQFLGRWQTMLREPSTEAPRLVNRRSQARTLLETEVSLEHLQPASLRQIARELGAQIDGEIIVDWERLATQGWTIDTELTCSVLSLPLDLALDDVLRPAGLSFRVIDEKLVQITTTDAALGDPDIEFYSVRGLLDKGVAAAEIAGRLPQVFRAVGTQEPGKRFFFDPDSGLLVAALPQPQQRALARFLSSWIQFQKSE